MIPSRRTSSGYTGSTTRAAITLAASAWWPGGWSSVESGSCRSTRAGWTTSFRGMGTTTSRGTTSSLPERPTSQWPACSADLSQRGLLDETLVIWGGEFGRLPIAQKSEKPGRDHNPNAFTFWLAGGGVKGGVAYGETDEIGYHAVVDRVHVNDLHATILKLLGLDHERLTYKYNGRRFRLTDVAGKVITKILA